MLGVRWRRKRLSVPNSQGFPQSKIAKIVLKEILETVSYRDKLGTNKVPDNMLK
jgi:hypothetical protein